MSAGVPPLLPPDVIEQSVETPRLSHALPSYSSRTATVSSVAVQKRWSGPRDHASSVALAGAPGAGGGGGGGDGGEGDGGGGDGGASGAGASTGGGGDGEGGGGEGEGGGGEGGDRAAHTGWLKGGSGRDGKNESVAGEYPGELLIPVMHWPYAFMSMGLVGMKVLETAAQWLHPMSQPSVLCWPAMRVPMQVEHTLDLTTNCPRTLVEHTQPSLVMVKSVIVTAPAWAPLHDPPVQTAILCVPDQD